MIEGRNGPPFLQCFPVFKERNRKKISSQIQIYFICVALKKQNLRLYNNNHHHCNAEQNVN